MKRILPFILFFISLNVGAQIWLTESTRDKKNISFQEEQIAFKKFCKENQVENGFYYVNGEKKKLAGYKQFKRKEYIWENNIDSRTGNLPSFNQYLIRDSHPRNSSNWISLGTSSSTGGYAGIGRVNVIAFHPTDPNTIFLGAPAGGLWKTTEGGNDWIPLTDDMASVGVSGIVISPNFDTDQTLFIATGDRDANDMPSAGIFKSVDGGTSWTITSLTFNTAYNHQIYRFMAHPTDPSMMYAATSNGLYLTQDNGENWAIISSIVFNDLEFNPDDPTIMYGATKTYANSGAYKSTNAGNNWTESFTANGRRASIAVSADDSSLVYAIVANLSGGLEGIYKSSDFGSTYSQIVNGNDPEKKFLNWSCVGTGDNNGQGWYDLTIAANPLDANEVFIGGVNAWKTSDGGDNWTCTSHWWGDCGLNAVHADKHEMIFRPGTSELYEGNDGGIYKTLDNGANWTDLSNTLVISQIYKMGASTESADHCITGLQDNGTKLMLENTWYDVIGGDGMDCAIDPVNNDIQYGSLYRGDIRKTTDLWVSSFPIRPDGAGFGNWVTPFIIDPNNTEIIYAGYSALWKTIDGGSSWEAISPSYSPKIDVVCIAPSNSEVIYFCRDFEIMKTIDGGTTWVDITNDALLQNHIINNITVKNDDPNTVWLSLSFYDSSCVLQTTDGGTSWTNISTGLPEVPAHSIAENTLNTENLELYVATKFGVYCKLGDEPWFSFNNGLPNTHISEVEVFYGENSEDSRLMASTYGRGLWSTTLYAPPVNTLSIDPTSLHFDYIGGVLPFNISSNIAWTIENTSDWLTLDINSGEGDAVISVSCLENFNTESRETTLVINGPDGLFAECIITQDQTPFTLSIDPETLSFPHLGGSSPLNIISNAAWTIENTSDWISLDADSGEGDAVISVICSENPDTESRQTTLTINGPDDLSVECIITQDQAPFTLTIDPETLNFDYLGGDLPLNVISNTTWTIENTSDWLTLDMESGEGDTEITVSCTENPNTESRQTTLSFSGPDDLYVECIVTQDQSPFTLTISPESATVPYIEGNINFNIISNTSWILTEDADWFSTDITEGFGNQTVNVSYDFNDESSSRTDDILIEAGDLSVIFTLTQTVQGAYLTVNPNSLIFEAEGGELNANLLANQAWTITNEADWVDITPMSGSGDQYLTINCQNLKTNELRETTLSFIGDNGGAASLHITQNGAESMLNIVPESIEVNYEAGECEFNITHNFINAPIITNNNDWVELSSVINEGSIQVTLAYDENISIEDRIAEITVNGPDEFSTIEKSFILTQKGRPNSIKERSLARAIWPNPSNNEIHINVNKNTKHIAIRDMNGILVYSETKPNKNIQLNIKSWPSGTYVLQIFETDITKRLKFIVSH